MNTQGNSGPATVRGANIHDVPEIYDLVEQHSERGNLLPRSMSDLYRHLRDFFVVDVDRRVVGCGALEIFTEELGEVRSLVIHPDFKGSGLGQMLVNRLVTEAQSLGLRRLMALTYVPEFFHTLGFATVAKETLPEKVWGVCVKCYKFNHCDEIAVVRNVQQPRRRENPVQVA